MKGSFILKNRTLTIICCLIVFVLLVSCSSKEVKNLHPVNSNKEALLPTQTPTLIEKTVSRKILEKTALLLGINNSTYLFYTDMDKIKYIKKDDRIIVPSDNGFYTYKSINREKDGELQGKKAPYLAGWGGSKLSTWKCYINGQNSISEKDFDSKLIAGTYWSNELLFVGNKYALVKFSYEWERGPGGRGGGGYENYLANLGTIFNDPTTADGLDYEKWRVDNHIKGLIDIFDSKTKKIIEDKMNQIENKAKNDPKYQHSDGYNAFNTRASRVILQRNEGVWKLNFPIEEYNRSAETVIEDNFENITLPKELVSFNKLSPTWSELKKKFPDMIDAVSSPNDSIIVVLTKNKIKVFTMPIEHTSVPELEVDIPENVSIVSCEWALGNYVQKWVYEVSKIK